jgi:hypothetical protein
MKTRRPLRITPKAKTAKTGEHCPMTGWWVPVNRNGDKRFAPEGSIMPADQGESVIWALVASEAGVPDPISARWFQEPY